MNRWLWAVFLSLFLLSPFARAASESPTVSFVLGWHPTVVLAPQLASDRYQVDADIAARAGYEPLTRSWGAADERPVGFLIWQNGLNTTNTRAFLLALMQEKHRLMDIYRLNDADYNRLSAMAFGIYGVETKFGRSLKYHVKEDVPWLIADLKAAMGRSSSNSRGGTQIKNVPDDITQAYPEIQPSTLRLPRNSAIATLGFLAETVRDLRHRRDRQQARGVQPGETDLSYITDATIYDYSLYIYSGQMRKILKGPTGTDGATVIDNTYVLGVRHYVRALSVWELAR